MMEFKKIIKDSFKDNLFLSKRREGLWQIELPIFHKDDDPIEIFVTQCPTDKNKARICDCGLSLTRISFDKGKFDEFSKGIFDDILKTEGIKNGEGELYGDLYIDSDFEDICKNVLKFAFFVKKICNYEPGFVFM